MLRHGNELIVGYSAVLIARMVSSALSKKEYHTFTCDVRRNFKYLGMKNGMISMMLDTVDWAATAADARRAEAADRGSHQRVPTTQRPSPAHTFKRGDCAYITGL